MLRSVTSALLGALSSAPPTVLAAIAAGILVVGVVLGVLVGRRSGNKSLAQRLVALGSRLGVGPEEEDYTIEGALSYLEAVTGAATEAVTDSSADAIRLRRSLDVLPLGLVLCDEVRAVRALAFHACSAACGRTTLAAMQRETRTAMAIVTFAATRPSVAGRGRAPCEWTMGGEGPCGRGSPRILRGPPRRSGRGLR